MGVALPIIVIAYLLGSFPSALVVARRAGHDPTVEGSGNPGATNVYRVAGRRAGAVVFAADIAKGMAAAGLGYAAGGRALAFAAGVASVAGHTVPPWGRRGGKGVATSAGMTIVLFPVVGAGAFVTWITLARLTGKASVASLVVALGVPLGVLAIGRPAWEVAAVAALALYVVARHRANIARLLRGEERSLER